jgi:hypothetical protein
MPVLGSGSGGISPSGSRPMAWSVGGSLKRVHVKELDGEAPALTEGCEDILSLEFETCPDGCAPTRCDVCLLNVQHTADVTNAELHPFYRDGVGCSAIDYRGGISEDLGLPQQVSEWHVSLRSADAEPEDRAELGR